MSDLTLIRIDSHEGGLRAGWFEQQQRDTRNGIPWANSYCVTNDTATRTALTSRRRDEAARRAA